MDKTVWLKRPEAARYLGVPEQTLMNWVPRKRGPVYYKIGNHVRYKQSDLDAWLESRKRDPQAGAPPQPAEPTVPRFVQHLAAIRRMRGGS